VVEQGNGENEKLRMKNAKGIVVGFRLLVLCFPVAKDSD
jgi:hypothetical protein